MKLVHDLLNDARVRGLGAACCPKGWSRAARDLRARNLEAGA